MLVIHTDASDFLSLRSFIICGQVILLLLRTTFTSAMEGKEEIKFSNPWFSSCFFSSPQLHTVVMGTCLRTLLGVL